jgi:hypothetical protein
MPTNPADARLVEKFLIAADQLVTASLFRADDPQLKTLTG